MMFLKALFIYLCFFTYCASCMPINYKNKSINHNGRKKPVDEDDKNIEIKSTLTTTKKSLLNETDNKPIKMLYDYKNISTQRQTFLTESPNILKEFLNIGDRDLEFMKTVFDVKKQLFKNVQKQILHQLQHRKEEIRKSVVKEVAKKIFPSSLQNEMHMAENLIKLSPAQIFKTALHWGIITSNADTGNTYKINDIFSTQNEVLPSTMRDLLTRDNQRYMLPDFMTSLDNDKNNMNFWTRKENAKEASEGDATQNPINNFSGYGRQKIYERKTTAHESTQVNEITQTRSLKDLRW